MIKSQSLNMPVFALVVAGSIGAGVLADRNWLHSQSLEGVSCDFVRPAALSALQPLAASQPAAPATTPSCSGTPAVGAVAVPPAPVPVAPPAAACPGSSLPALQAGTLPMLPQGPTTIVRAAPVDDGMTGDNRDMLMALGGTLGLLGIGAAWWQSTRGTARRRTRTAAAVLPIAALADPLDPARPVDTGPATADAVSDGPGDTPAFAPADPGNPGPSYQQRRHVRDARKARWRRLAYILLFGGSVAAVAASTSRGLWFGDPEMPLETGQHQRHARVHQPLAPHQGSHGESFATTPHRIGGTLGNGPAMPGQTPRGTLDGRGGAAHGIVGDHDRARLPIDRERGERLGAHMFDGHGGGDPIVSDPHHGSVEDRLKGSGGGGSGAGGTQGGAHGTLTPDSGKGGDNGGGGGSGGGGGNNGGTGSGTGGGTGGTDSGHGGTGGHDSEHGGGNGGHDGGNGNHDGDHGGGDPGNWLGNDPGHGGGTPVPEPDTIGLLALGIVGLALSRSRRLRQRLKLARPAP